MLKGIMIMIQQFYLNQTDASRDCGQCWEMVFDTIPERHVTRSEVEDLLQRILVPSEEARIATKYLCDNFELMFPSSKGPLRPRSLKHLSRCRIRQNMREANTIWYGVQYLPLPRYLKEYILIRK